MAAICPTITAYDEAQYRSQIENVQPFARRLHIDLMDGQFAPKQSPGLDKVWWPEGMRADIHLMYQRPMQYLSDLIKLRPNLVIIHAEAEADHVLFAGSLHKVGIRFGLALLQDTDVHDVAASIKNFSHVLIFSGHLGYHGGEADLSLLEKVKQVRALHPEAEIGWDGGINDQNARQLVEAGVDVLNVGGYIQKAPDPSAAYAKLREVIQGA